MSAANANFKSDGESTNSSSNQKDQSRKEFDSFEPVAKEHRASIKRFLTKIGQQVGTIKVTEFSKDYLDKVKAANHYKPDPKYVSSPVSSMMFEAPKDSDPFEKLNHCMIGLNNHFPDKEALTVTRDVVKNLSQIHRGMQQRIRHVLQLMQTFLNVDCVSLDKERRALLHYRQEKDFATHEYSNNPTEARRSKLKHVEQRFETQKIKVTGILDQIPQKKMDHSIDLLTVLAELKLYHEACYAECQRLRKYRSQIDSASLSELA